jgi:hypothetical protein
MGKRKETRISEKGRNVKKGVNRKEKGTKRMRKRVSKKEKGL